jgi:hypothetical protein
LPSVCHPRGGAAAAQYAVAMQMPVLGLSAEPWRWALSFVLAMYLTIPGIKNIGL